MRNWSEEELRRIAETDDLHISPFREDGKTYGTLTWIWSLWSMVAFVFARTTARTRAGIRRRCARKPDAFTAAGMTKEVSFEPISEINDRIDGAYRARYKRQRVPRCHDQCTRTCGDGEGIAYG